MFKNIVTIFRNNTTHQFFYDADGVLLDPVYVNMATRYKTEGKLIEELIEITDELVYKRETFWDTEESFDAFLSEWYEYRPHYLLDIQTYCADYDHIFHTERIPG
jgi:hypothetical protein